MNLLSKRTLVILLAFVAVFSSCSSDDDAPVVINPTFLTAKIDGEHFESNPEETNAILHITDEVIPFLALQGDDGDGNIIQIQVAEFWSIGTYQIQEDPFPNFLGIGSYFMNGQVWGSSEFSEVLQGELIVTEYTPNVRIEGTFHFYVQNIFTEEVMHITEGKFNMPVFTIEN